MKKVTLCLLWIRVNVDKTDNEFRFFGYWHQTKDLLINTFTVGRIFKRYACIANSNFCTELTSTIISTNIGYT